MGLNGETAKSPEPGRDDKMRSAPAGETLGPPLLLRMVGPVLQDKLAWETVGGARQCFFFTPPNYFVRKETSRYV